MDGFPPEHLLVQLGFDSTSPKTGEVAHLAVMRRVVRDFADSLAQELRENDCDFHVLSEEVAGHEESVIDMGLMELEMRRALGPEDDHSTLLVVDSMLMHRMIDMDSEERDLTLDSLRTLMSDGPSLGVALVTGVSGRNRSESNAAMLSMPPGLREQFIKFTVHDADDVAAVVMQMAQRVLFPEDEDDNTTETLPCGNCANTVLYWMPSSDFVSQADELGEEAVALLEQFVAESDESDPMIWHCAICDAWGDNRNVMIPTEG